MKKFLTFILFSILLIGCKKDDDSITADNCNFVDFYYYEGAPINMGEMSRDYILIACDTTYSDTEIQNFIATQSSFNQNYVYTIHTRASNKYKKIPLKLNSSKTCEEITSIMADLEQNAIISYIHYAMQTDDCTNAFDEPLGDLCINSYGPTFYVQVFDENNLTDLNNKIAETNTELIRQDIYMPEWFELRATKNSKGDALQMSNYFYESGLFAHSEPYVVKYPVE